MADIVQPSIADIVRQPIADFFQSPLADIVRTLVVQALIDIVKPTTNVIPRIGTVKLPIDIVTPLADTVILQADTVKMSAETRTAAQPQTEIGTSVAGNVTNGKFRSKIPVLIYLKREYFSLRTSWIHLTILTELMEAFIVVVL